MNKSWSIGYKPVRMSTSDKEKLYSKASQCIKESLRLSTIVNRIEIKAGRMYFYCLHEQFGWDNPKAVFIKPLIDGKYIEVLMARITLYDKIWETCTADWQRHNKQWIHLYEGNMDECVKFIEKNQQWFC